MFVSTIVSTFVLVGADAFPVFPLACTRALHREKVEKGEWCVPGCQNVRCTLAALVAVLVRLFNQCIQMKPMFFSIFCRFCLMCCTCSYSCYK